MYSNISYNNYRKMFTFVGVAVLFANLKIDQFHSIAWFNVANGVAQLFLFVLLFRGESSCNKIEYCEIFYNWQNSISRPRAFQVFISYFKCQHVNTFSHPNYSLIYSAGRFCRDVVFSKCME